MKKFLKLLLLCGLVTSCNDAPTESGVNSDSPASVFVTKVINGKICQSSRSLESERNNALAFTDENSYETFKSTLENLSHEERIDLVKRYGVKNLHLIAEEADTELDNIGESTNSEEEFRQKYINYVERYKGILITNDKDKSDLTLYVPNEDNIESYIVNADGRYVVGKEVKKVEFESIVPARATIASSIETNALLSSNYINEYVVSPQSGKKVYFTISRKYDTVHVSMFVKKKMWYGWKDDTHRDLLYEVNFTGAQYKWIVPSYSRFWANSKKRLESDILQITDVNTLTGTIHTWTDMTAEHDSNGDLIIEPYGNTMVPRCLLQKSIDVTVRLPRQI